MSHAVEIKNLYWKYPSFQGKENPWVINGLNFSVNNGEVLGITGPSGAGKTTLCRLILGVLPHGTKIPFRQVNNHIRGTVQVLGKTITHVNESANEVDGIHLGQLEGVGILSPQVGMILQDPENQFLQMSLLHELAFGLSLQGIELGEMKDRASRALDMVGLGYLWSDAEYIHPLDLSGGQKQRAAIAAFLALSPEVLIMDEPTSDLDPLGKHEIIQTVRRLKEDKGMTIILVEHDPELLYMFCDRIALMDNGQIVTVAEPSIFYTQKDLLEEHGVYSFDVTRVAISAGVGDLHHIPVLVEDMVSLLKPLKRTLKALPVSQPTQENIIQVSNLRYRYQDGTEALRGVNLTINRGDMVALLGINGSGKTTLAKILAGIYPLGSGKATILGQDLSLRNVRKKIPHTVGYVFQNPDHQLFTRRVYNEIAYGLENLGILSQERDAIIRKTLEIVGLSEFMEEDPLFLGKGQRQRLAVASVLAMGPEILIVDEPTTGQDFRMISGIMNLLEELHQQNKTIVIITHDINLVANHCTRAVVMLDGIVTFDGDPRDLFANPSILEHTHLRSPQSVRLSLAMREINPEYPILLNAEEWIAALRP